MIGKSNEGQPSAKPEKAPKDLITLRNARNGETYKFACKTCIDGHRAPLCDPKKHRGKIMFRRPAPGRPARQCGHPKAAKCDCLSKRTLCCVLEPEQWDQVERGEIPEVHMYDSREQLEEIQPPGHPSRISTSYSDFPAIATRSHPSLAMHPSIPLRLSHSARDVYTERPDLADWKATTPPFPLDPQPLHSDLNHPHLQDAVASGSTTPYELPRGNIPQSNNPMSTPWQGPRPEYMNYNAPQFSFGQYPPVESMSVDQQIHMSPATGFNSSYQQPAAAPVGFPPGIIDPPHGFNTFQAFQQTPTVMHDYGMNTDLNLQSRLAMVPAQQPTQSCCSSKPRAPQITHANARHYPDPTPSRQFPCSRCASAMCTCNNCPEVMQDSLRNGAWAQSCGRGGHLDAGQFAINTPLPQVQHQPIEQLPTPMNSAGSSPEVGSATHQWHGIQDVMHSDEHAFQEATVDPSMVYQNIDWSHHTG